MNRTIGIGLLIMAAGIGRAQTRPEDSPGSAAARRTGVDGVIALVNVGMSEQLIIRRLQREAKAYDLTTDDLVKLKKGGVPSMSLKS